MELKDFIKPELLILIPVLYLIGVGMKKSNMRNTLIPMCLGIASVFLSALWVIATSEISTLKDVTFAVFTSVTQGVLAAGASVYINQLYVQSRKEE